MALSPNSQFGRYEIRSLLGKGGMGEVYLAYDTQLRRQVAIKLLPAEFTQNKVRLSRFEREAYAASSLNHPNILTIHEIGQQNGLHYMATEYIEGESLRQRMTRTRIELREVLGIATQVADALSAAHQAGIVHRDIKPENVMLRRDGYVKVLDFGLAKLADETAAAAKQAEVDMDAQTMTVAVKTEPGVVMGTASYMSPEQARGLELDGRSDIWSIGVVIYELVAGRLPFEGATTTDVLAMILHREPPSLLLHKSEVPAELERIVEKGLAKEKEERYQTAKDLSVDVKRLRQRLEVEAELERSVAPDTRGGAVAATSGRDPAISGTTKATESAPTAEANAARNVTSAEYVIGEVKRHKRGVLLVLATLIAAIAGLTYFFYFAQSGKAAIDKVAVLPFVNASNDPNAEYLSDGISDSLINSLSLLPQLKVIARSSTFKYKGKEIDPQEVALALGVEAIVTGRIVQRGDDLQISVEMVKAEDKTQMWGAQYNRKAADLQAVQEEMARTISEKLRLRLTGAQEQQLTKHATKNPEAYQLYLNGVFYRRKPGRGNVQKAIDYYTQAIALDPNFSLAYAGVADAYRFLGVNSVMDPKEALGKARAAAQKALEIDETVAEAHVALGLIKEDVWEWSEAESEFKRALELNPNLAESHFRYGNYLSLMGRHTEALSEMKKAAEYDPLRIPLKISEGNLLYRARRYDESVQVLQNALKLDPSPLGHVFLGYTYDAKGMYAEAINEYQKALSIIQGESTTVECYLGYAYAMSGQRNKALAILNKLKTTKDYVSPGELATLYAGLGDKDSAFQSLERSYSGRDPQMQFLKVDPHFDLLRSDPRFQNLMRRVGLPQ